MEILLHSSKTSPLSKDAVLSLLISYFKRTISCLILILFSYSVYALETYLPEEDLEERGQCLGINKSLESSDNHYNILPTTGPVSLNWATYFGEAIYNVFSDVVVDDDDNIYAFGSSVSQGFDAVLAKFDANGNLLWSTFLGGTDADNNNPNDTKDYGKIALDQAGNIYVTGITNSSDFPTLNAFQGSKSGGIDAFVAKYNPDGILLMSSYLGGSADEQTLGGGAISVDLNGNIFVAGNTLSDGFFPTSGAFQNTFSGGSEPDLFIVKISPDFSTISGTYWGDESEDVLKDLITDSNGKVWAVGYSNDSGLSLNGEQTLAIGDRDGILLSFNNDLSQLEYGTFYGGQFDESIEAIELDDSGNIYLGGNTFSTNDFPILNPFQNFYNGGEEGFVVKLSASGIIQWSTFLGGAQNEKVEDLALDANNNVYITGSTSSDDFPVFRTAQETYNTINCEQDGFVFKFNNNGSRDWATYYGGFRREDPKGIVVNTNDQVFIVGKTESTDLPVSPGAFKPTPAFAGVNCFISSFEIACPSTPILIHSTENGRYHDQFWCSQYEYDRNHHFSEDSCAVQLIGPPGYTNYSWLKNGSPVNGVTDRYYSISDPGSQGAEFQVVINDGNDCSDISTSVPDNVSWVRPMCGFGGSFDKNELPHLADLLEGYDNEIFCQGEIINYSLSADGFCGAVFQWQKDFEDISGAHNSDYLVTSPGCYRIAIQNSFTGCTVYSQTKKFIVLDSIKLNDYDTPYAESCLENDTVVGCSSVRLRARTPHCASCSQSIQGLTYTWYKDGVPFSNSNSYGYFSTTEDGRYHAEVDNGTCTIVSNFVEVRIRPTEPPVWVSPTNVPVCIKDLDSLVLGITHPDANDSSTIRFEVPYPATQVTGYDSVAVIYDAQAGCSRVRLTTKEGCTSFSDYIEFHDTLTPQIDANGPLCTPIYLRTEMITSCHLDSVLWYLGDSLLASYGYDAQYYATIPGPYILRVKNACGDFYSDTLHLSDAMEPPLLSPDGPVCLPATLTADFPNPDGNTIVRWYNHPTAPYCSPNNNYLIPDKNENTLVAGVPGYYFAVIEDTISGCKSTCSNIVEIQRSVAGAGLSPSNDVYFCDGAGAGNVTMSVTPSSPSFTYQWYRNNDMISGATYGSYTTSEEGVYRAFVENSCDNSFTPVVSIFSVDNPELTIDQSDTVFICSIDSISLTSSFDQPLLFQWFKDGLELNEKEDSFLNLIDPGLYQVYGLNNNTQCNDWSQEILVLNSLIINADIAITPACNNTCTGALDATVTGGIPFNDGTYQYAWSNGETSASISNLCQGVYTLTVTDDTGCSTTFSEQIGNGFSISGSVDSVSCGGADDGSITIETSGGLSPFTYTWSNGETGNTVQSLSPGTYQVTVSDTQGCTQIESMIVPTVAPLSLSLTGTEVSCFGNSDAAIQATIEGGTAPFQMNWNTMVSLDSNNLAAGIYEVTVTDQKGCTIEESIEIFEPEELTGTISVLDSLKCFGDSNAHIEIDPNGGVPPYSYFWNTAQTDDNIDNLSAGIYQVTITDTNNCTFTNSFEVAEVPNIEIAVDQIENVNCWGGSDGSVSVLPSGGTAPYTYLWNTGQTGSQISNLAIGEYEVTVSDFNNCSQILTQNISQFDSMTLQLTVVDVSCYEGMDGQIQLSIEGGNPPYNEFWDQGINQDMLSSGWYSLTVTDQNNCEIIDSIQINEPDLLELSIEILDSLICFGDQTGSVEVDVQGGVSPYEYSWSTGENGTMIDQLGTGSYIVTVTDQNGCFDMIDIEIPEIPELILEVIDISQVSCWEASDGSVELEANGGTGNYEFFLNNSEQNDFGIFENLESGSYSVFVRDENNCQSNLLEINVGTPEDLVVEFSTEEVFCSGTSTGTAIISVSGGTEPYQYIWSNSFNTSFSNSLAEGIYTVTISDNHNCTSTIDFEITSPEAMTTFSMATDNSCFGALDGMIEIMGSEGGTPPYQYFLNSAPLDENSLSFENLHEGVFELVTEDSNGCRIVDFLDIDMPDEIIVDLGEDLNLTFGESVLIEPDILGGVEPFIYNWNPTRYLSCEDGEDIELCSQTLINTPENTLTYNLLISDALGCTGSDDIMVRVSRDKLQIFMPNIFTPNEDGLNDFLFVQTHLMISEIESFRVYNRWGELVFQQQNFTPNTESLGWNGIFKGQKAPVGTYVYIIVYKNISNESSAFSGEVTLVR